MKSPTSSCCIEREFGVPIPGEVLEPARWTKTALKKLPEKGPLEWHDLFGRQAPLVLDIGCGNGRYLLGSAVARPDHDHVGIDILPLVLRYATRRANQRGLVNLRFAAGDGWRFLSEYVKDGDLREVHCYHPQPYHDPRQKVRRLLTPAFLALAHRKLEPGGRFFVQTDNGPYWKYMLEAIPAFFAFHEEAGVWPDAPQGRTRREILARQRGIVVYRGWGEKRNSLTGTALAALTQELPAPLFDAGPRPRDLDDQEKE